MKLLITFSNGHEAIAKLSRHPLDYEQPAQTSPFSDSEQPFAEVAAFHLDRVLGYRRALPTVGRRIHIERELKPVAGVNLTHNIFIEGGLLRLGFQNSRPILHPQLHL